MVTWRLSVQQQHMCVCVCMHTANRTEALYHSEFFKSTKKIPNTLGIQKTNRIIQKGVIHVQIDDKSPNAESCFLISEVLLLLLSD